MKIIFFGSDDFAAMNLKRLIDDGFAVVACVTQPDRAKGRGMKVMASVIKTIAQEHRIPVLQPEDLKDQDFLHTLQGYHADLFIVIAYGKFLPSVVLKIPKIFCINVHGSLLPKYRGAAPVNWAIIHGDSQTGYTIMRMNPKMDAGEILYQESITILDDDTGQSLRLRMAEQSARGLSQVVKDLQKGPLPLKPQEESQVTYAPKLTKDMGRIHWEKSAREIHNLIRGLFPWPAAYTFYNGKMLKILKSRVLAGADGQVPGQVLQVSQEGIRVACGQDILLIEHVHPESGKPMPANSFCAGHGVKEGRSLDG